MPYDMNSNMNMNIPTVISSQLNFFKENPRHRTKTEAEEDSNLFEIKKDQVYLISSELKNKQN